jgi:GH15 family glucan-1,4-alpha-glucosidase
MRCPPETLRQYAVLADDAVTEEYDVRRQQRGNLPQAFVHAAFLEAAHRLAGGTDASGRTG